MTGLTRWQPGTTGTELAPTDQAVHHDNAHDRLHHLIHQPLLAAERALDEGHVADARDLLQLAMSRLPSVLSQATAGTTRSDDVVAAAVREVREVWGSDLRLVVRFGTGGAVCLTPAQAQLVHDVVHEVLTNAAKHRPAAPTRLRLRSTDRWLRICVAQTSADDDVQPSESTGTGLQRLERAALDQGAVLDVRVGPTTVAVLEVPLAMTEVPADA